MRNLLLFAAAAALLVCIPDAAAGQIRINGQVVDNQTLEPIIGAEVVVSNARGRFMGRAFSDDAGRFTFVVRRDGGYSFEASRIGYRANETPILWTDGFRAYEVEIRLDSEAVLLAPIEVLARSRAYESPLTDAFMHRLESGQGHYFTLADIRRIKPGRVSDLLVRVPGLRLQSSGAGLQRMVTMNRIGGGSCAADIFVDGMLWSLDLGPGTGGAGFSVDDAVSPGSVLAIEVYRGLSTVPPEFITPRSRCGVVAIWTRRSDA